MRLFISFIILFSGLVSAHPVPEDLARPLTARATSTTAFGISAAQIVSAVPSTASCLAGNAACRNATEMAPFINKSFAKFGFTTPGEQAALFSLMAFESGAFQFDVNMFPGRPGQGTRNMMMFDFILPYAVQYNTTGVHAIRPDLTLQSTSADVPDDTQKNSIRATVLSDTLSFASAAWFLRTKCGPEIALGLKTATEDAFNAYMGTGCINAGEDPARLALYQKTLTAMGA